MIGSAVKCALSELANSPLISFGVSNSASSPQGRAHEEVPFGKARLRTPESPQPVYLARACCSSGVNDQDSRDSTSIFLSSVIAETLKLKREAALPKSDRSST